MLNTDHDRKDDRNHDDCADSGDSRAALPNRKSEIVAATIRVIERKGINGASMRAIAQELGLTTGVITHYFSDKDQLLLEVLQTCFVPWNETIVRAKDNVSPWDSLRHIFFSTLPSFHQPRARVQVWLGMLLQLNRDANLWHTYQDYYNLIRMKLSPW